MIGETVTYTLLGRRGEEYEIPAAFAVAPGLVVFRLPNDLNLNNPCRWQIGHHSGRCIAEAMRREDAIRGAELLTSLNDWSKDADALRREVDELDLFIKLSTVDCVELNSEYLRGDVSGNGLYTDVDIEMAAAEFKADGFNALEILTAMADRVPWMGLDTNDFNEAHDRIVRLADAD